MNSSTKTYTRLYAALVIAFLFAIPNVSAQDLFLQDQLGSVDNFQSGDPVTMTSKFKILTDTRTGILSVTAQISPDWHIFSMKDTKGPIPSKISVAESKNYKLIGKFKASKKPNLKDEDGFDQPCEEFEGRVVWSAPIEIAEGIDPQNISISGVYNGQTCQTNGGCIPLTIDVVGKFAGFDDKLVVEPDFAQTPIKIEDFQPEGVHSKIQAKLVRKSGLHTPIQPGEVLQFEVTATPHEGWHLYSYSLEKTQYMSTIVGFSETNSWPVKGPIVSAEPDKGEAFGKPAFYYHEPVTWTFYISIPKDAKKNESYPIKGAIGLQTCTDSNCDPPTGVTFEAFVPIGKSALMPVKWANASYGAAAKANKAQPFVASEAIPQDEEIEDDDNENEGQEETYPAIADSPEQLEEMLGYYNSDAKINYVTLNNDAKTTFWTAIFGAFVGGMLLNLMPCVFPVLGLKVMGFVMQAGSEPKKIRNHGIAFTAGLVVSMWVLAGFILFLKLSLGKSVNWGQQMGNPYFVCGIIVLLFLLGLNMAGVFEIGTSLTSVGGKTQQKKGYAGSFFSGILTTLIATPCSGPFLGAAMGYTLAQPAFIALILFTVFALGIAMPYLVLSFFPSLIAKLPKPGPWMETFKVTMAFALFATVAFFARTFGSQTGIKGISWLVMALVVIGLAAYVYGQWSPSDVRPLRRFAIGYGLAGAIALLGGYMCYDASQQQGEVVSHGAWERWEPGKVEYTLARRRPIIWVDYTADW